MSQPSFAAGQNMILGGLSTGAPLVQQGLGQGQALTGNALDVGSRFGSQAEQAIGAGMGPVNAEQFSEAGLQKYMSPYLKNVVEAQQALQQQEAAQQRSALSGQAIMSGAFGGDRGGIAQANLARQQSLANQATLSNLLQGGYGQALGAFQQQQGVNLAAGQANRAAMQNAANQLSALGQQQYAQSLGAGQNLYNMGLGAGQALYGMGTGAGQAYAGLGGQAEQAALNAGQTQMAAGQIQQQTDQAAKTAMYNQFLQQQGYPFQQAQFLANLAMGTGALSGSTTTTQQPSGWSDRRLKENIRKVGETFDGQTIYAYNLKGEKHTQLGLMAQEVEKHTPEAVGESHGYKTLDYKKATDDAADRGHFAAGGLVPSSMGGAVYEPGEFARGGFAEGGDAEPTTTTTPATPANPIAALYQSKLGRTGTADEYKYWSDLMASRGLSADQIGDAIANSEEGKTYATKQADTQSKVASGDLMATGIKNAPYQETLKYNPSAFAPRAPVTKNASGFAAAAPGSSYSSFAPPTTGTPQATGKGPATGSYTPTASGKLTAPSTTAPTNPVPAPRYGSALQPPSTGSSAPTISGKGPATIGYPGSGTSMPTASGKSPSTAPTAAKAGGGRVGMYGGGAALLQQLAAQHAAQYGQMPGAPGTEPMSRIKHTLQMPSAEAQRRLSPGSSTVRPKDLASNISDVAKTGENIGKLYDMGTKAKTYLAGGVDDTGKRVPSLRERLNAAGQPEQGPTKDGASLDVSDNIKLAGGKVDPSDWASNTSNDYEMPTATAKGPSSIDFAARGGRIQRFAGGRTGYAGGGGRLPTGLAPEDGIEIPDEVAGYKLGDLGPKGSGGGGSGGGGLSSALGTAAAVASLGSTAAKIIPFLASLSDRRVKENAKVIGKLYDGQKVYRYDFGDGRTEIGLMAQEVEKHNPDAVRTVNGVKMVDYERAVSRVKKQGGGGLSDILNDVEYSVAPEEERGLAPAPVQLAAATRPDVASDAPLPGLGAVSEPPKAETGLNPLLRSASLDISPRRPQGESVEVAELNAGNSSFDRALSRTFKEEGGLNKRDTNGEPSLYGINRRYHPDFFDNPTRENAARIYRTQYWDAIDGDSLSPELAHVAFDTAVIAGVGKARELIKASGGDPMKLLELRKEFQDGLIARDPEKYGPYQRTWDRRINNLRSDISGQSVEENPSLVERAQNVVRRSNYEPQSMESAGRPQTTPYNAPFETIGRKVAPNLPEELRSPQFIKPLLAFAGTMLASNKPRFSQALGEGLVGALAASNAAETLEQGLASNRLEMEGKRLDLAKGALGQWGPNGPRTVTYKDADGTYKTMLIDKWYDLYQKGEAPDLDPAAKSIAIEYGRKYKEQSGKIDRQELPEVGGPKKDEKPEPATPQGVTFDDESKKAASEDRRAALLGLPEYETGKPESVAYYGQTMKNGNEAREAIRNASQLAGVLAQAGDVKGMGVSGFAFDDRAAMVNMANTLLRGLGGKGIESKDNAAYVKAITDKLSTLSGAQLSAAGGQESVRALELLKSAFANPSMDKDAYTKLATELMTMQRRAIDRANHTARWSKDSMGFMRNASNDFERKHGMDVYNQEQQVLQKIMKDKPDVFQMLVAGKTKNGTPIPRADIEKIGAQEGLRPGFSLYFMGGQ
jgi:hypothetical protein